MSMRGLGGTLVILGAGSFVLPFFGLQFRVMNIFGSAQTAVAIVAVAAGLALLFTKDS